MKKGVKSVKPYLTSFLGLSQPIAILAVTSSNPLLPSGVYLTYYQTTGSWYCLIFCGLISLLKKTVVFLTYFIKSYLLYFNFLWSRHG